MRKLKSESEVRCSKLSSWAQGVFLFFSFPFFLPCFSVLLERPISVISRGPSLAPESIVTLDSGGKKSIVINSFTSHVLNALGTGEIAVKKQIRFLPPENLHPRGE